MGQKLPKSMEKPTKNKQTADPMGHLIKASRHGVCIFSGFLEFLITFACQEV